MLLGDLVSGKEKSHLILVHGKFLSLRLFSIWNIYLMHNDFFRNFFLTKLARPQLSLDYTVWMYFFSYFLKILQAWMVDLYCAVLQNHCLKGKQYINNKFNEIMALLNKWMKHIKHYSLLSWNCWCLISFSESEPFSLEICLAALQSYASLSRVLNRKQEAAPMGGGVYLHFKIMGRCNWSHILIPLPRPLHPRPPKNTCSKLK